YVGGVGKLVVVDERKPALKPAAHRAPEVGTVGGIETPAVAARAVGGVPGAEVGGDDADVIPGEQALASEIAQLLDEGGEPQLELRLLGGHRGGIVDHEQQIDFRVAQEHHVLADIPDRGGRRRLDGRSQTAAGDEYQRNCFHFVP